MDDLRDRFHILDEVAVPDRIASLPPLPDRPPRRLGVARRGVTTLVAVVLTVASFAILVRAFGGGSRPERVIGAGSLSVDLGSPIPVGDFPNAIATGAGAVWVSAHPADGPPYELVRLDPVTGDVVARIPVPDLPPWEVGGGGLVALRDAVWVAGAVRPAGGSACCHAIVFRVDPATNQVVERVDLGPGFGQNLWIDETGFWVLVRTDEGPVSTIAVVRLDPTTHEEVARIPLPTGWAKQVFAYDGSIWVQGDRASTEDVDPDLLFEIDPAMNRYVGAVDLPTPEYLHVDGSSIWQRASGGIVRVDPSGSPTLVPLGGMDEGCCSALVSDGAGGIWAVARGAGPERLQVVHISAGGEIDGEAEATDLDPRLESVTSTFDPDHRTIWLAQYKNTVNPIRIVSG